MVNITARADVLHYIYTALLYYVYTRALR